jgi:hypothetical protein
VGSYFILKYGIIIARLAKRMLGKLVALTGTESPCVLTTAVPSHVGVRKMMYVLLQASEYQFE